MQHMSFFQCTLRFLKSVVLHCLKWQNKGRMNKPVRESESERTRQENRLTERKDTAGIQLVVVKR